MTRSLAIGLPYAADRFGGSNVSSFVMARALVDMGHRVHVIAHGTGPVIDEAEKCGLQVERLAAVSSVPGYARPDRFRFEQMLAFGACRESIQRLRLDIVHTNDLSMLRTWSAPTFTHGAALIAHWRSNFFKSWSVDVGLFLARTIIAVSNYSIRRFPDWGKAKATVEYNAFDLNYTREQRATARASTLRVLGLPEAAAVIGVFGNHIVRKRTHVLADVLNALPTTADGRPIFGLACGAHAEPYDRLLDSKMEAFGLQRRLLRPGFVRPVEQWMCACDVILAPAIDEPLARNVLEAQALEIPVVVSTDGGLRELVSDGKTGLLCDPDDIAAWINATRRLLEDSAFAQSMSRAGLEVVSKLNPQAHAERISAIYEKALNHRIVREAA
jgi:glycosyltransferase involved in cell wall biosynthesis